MSKKSILVSFILIMFLSACSIRHLSKIGAYKELTPETYIYYVNDSLVNIIDVRTASEYEKSHIKGALNVNYFAGNFKDDLKRLMLDKSRTTLIYCETQHRSLLVAKKMYVMGFHSIIDLDKGMMHWRKAGFPYISDTLPD